MDSVLAKQWHPVCVSNQLFDQPVGTIIMGEKVVVFRTSEGVKALKDLCVHRGAPLSQGKIIGEELRCPYHGWRYNGSGQCTHIPQQPASRTIPSKACTVSYACTEAAGLVWVCLDGNDESLLPPYEEYDDPTFITVWSGPFHVQAFMPRIVENFLDVGHLAFLHEGSLGDPAFPEISDYKVTLLEHSIITDEIALFQPNPDGRGVAFVTKYIYEVLKPSVARLKKSGLSPEECFSMMLAVLPEGPMSSQVFICSSRNYNYDASVELIQQRQKMIFDEDTSVLENQRPELLPLDLQEELHLTADRLSIAYRKWLRELNISWGTV